MESAAREGFGLFALPENTTGGDLIAGLPAGWVGREYRGLGVVHDLCPIEEGKARRGSLSAKHGLGAFPPHVDGAHLNVPPRLVVLWCVADQEGRPTLLYDWSRVESHLNRQQVEREVFVYRSGRSSRTGTIIGRGRAFVRYDPGCMHPATRNAAALLSQVTGALATLVPDVIEWEAGEGLVFDNWRMLHARGAPRSSGHRHLLRIWLDPNPRERK